MCSVQKPERPFSCLIMTTKMVRFWRNKAVLVSVYAERPRNRRSSSNNEQHHHHHHHHYHYVHHSIKQEGTPRRHGDAVKGYSRKAELLLYSRLLRESAPPPTEEPSPSQPKTISSNNVQPTSHIVSFQREPKQSGTPTCLGNLKRLISNCLGNLASPQVKKEKKKKKQTAGSRSIAMKSVMKSLKVKRKSGFISKLMSILGRRR